MSAATGSSEPDVSVGVDVPHYTAYAREPWVRVAGGWVPSALLVYQRGRVSLADCVPAPLPKQERRAPAYAEWPTCTQPVTLDQLARVCAQRMALYRRLEASLAWISPDDDARVFPAGSDRDLLSYVACLSATLCGGTEAYRPAAERARSVFLRGEAALDAYRLVWGLVRVKHLATWPGTTVESDYITTPFENVVASLSLVADTGARFVGGGRVRTPVAACVHDLLRVARTHHEANLVRGACEKVWTRHPGVAEVLRHVHDAYGSGAAGNGGVKRARPIGSGVPGLTITGLASVLEASPPCMRKMHERALAGGKRRLVHDERQVYYAFMAAHGLAPDTLIDVLAPAYLGDASYFREAVVQPARSGVWARKQALAGNYIGTSCRRMCASGACPFSDLATVGHALAACQRQRAAGLGIEDKEVPSGTPYAYTQRTRLLLDKRQERAASEVAMETA